ncbi:cAMP-activated global transcriptional regulator CRP [Mariprofundus micogutta]|uniref:cAMP-activated global transcriptional regulator CRP n=1 Tax=Mariprofundus micogutta TaxID=1921010 RepID=A0A1L8CND9_9PROT|nr:cyclic nucleotide-binding domain-containing protein [Mariprofundus micogutta]GAV20431.1 cAMP-activated global transcriptional regulator CRP [Mariprofundus micogutta]
MTGLEAIDDKIAMMQSMPVFGGVSGEALKFLLSLSERRNFNRWDYIFHEGDTAASMFVIQSGEVAVLKLREEHELLLKELQQGDCFGEMALLDLYSRSCSVQALNDVEVIEISQSAVFKLHEHNLEQFTIIQMNIGREISRRLRLTGDQLFLATQA